MQRYEDEDRLYYTSNGIPRYKQYLEEMSGVPAQDLWLDLFAVNSQARERAGYPTQKPEALLERIIRASSNENDIIADFFCGSGTTAAVAEKLNRKWICTDLGKFAIHTTRKRLIGVQRERKAKDQTYRAFEILNLGKYERQHFIGVNPNLREEEQRKQLEAKEADFLNLILKAYKAEKTDGLRAFHGKKAGRMVVVGPVNLPVTRLFIEEIILECRQKHITKVDLLGFEFEMGLFPNVLDEAKSKGIDIAPKYIPADVFDKRAVDKGQVVFHDVAFIEVKPLVQGKMVAVQLTDFSVFYSQDSIANAEATKAFCLRAGERYERVLRRAVPLATLSGGGIELEEERRLRGGPCCLDGHRGPRRPAEIRVDEDAGRVDDRWRPGCFGHGIEPLHDLLGNRGRRP